MPRKNLEGGWGYNPSMSVRLAPRDRRAIRELKEVWACTSSEVLRRALRLAYQDHRQHSQKPPR